MNLYHHDHHYNHNHDDSCISCHDISCDDISCQPIFNQMKIVTLFRSLEKGAEWLLTLFLRPRRLEGEDGEDGEDNYDYDDNAIDGNNHDNVDDNGHGNWPC